MKHNEDETRNETNHMSTCKGTRATYSVVLGRVGCITCGKNEVQEQKHARQECSGAHYACSLLLPDNTSAVQFVFLSLLICFQISMSQLRCVACHRKLHPKHHARSISPSILQVITSTVGSENITSDSLICSPCYNRLSRSQQPVHVDPSPAQVLLLVLGCQLLHQ